MALMRERETEGEGGIDRKIFRRKGRVNQFQLYFREACHFDNIGVTWKEIGGWSYEIYLFTVYSIEVSFLCMLTRFMISCLENLTGSMPSYTDCVL